MTLGMFWMWPAMDLFLYCGHLTARCDCTEDGEFADACPTDSGLLARQTLGCLPDRLWAACILQEKVGSREHGRGSL